MKENFVFRAVSSLVLVVFVFVSCSPPFHVPENPEPIKETPSVPIGQGNLVFAYMDANYRATAADTGTTALTVTGNELAAGVAVLSHIPDGGPVYDNEVRIINTNNKSQVSMFFRPGQPLPYRMAITVDGEDVIGDFSMYNYAAQTFSVSFIGGGNDFCTLSDITMNKNALTLWHDQSELNSSQNTRIRNMITALCIWESLALQLPDSDFTVTAYSPASRSVTTISRVWWNPFTWSSVREVVTFVLAAVAVIAFAAALVPVAPAMIAAASAGLGVSISLPTTGSIVAGCIAAAAAGGAVINEMLPDYGVFPVPPPPPGPIRIIIRQGVESVTNNGRVFTLPNIGDSITFDLQIFGATFTQAPTISVFDPNLDPVSGLLVGYNVGTNPIAYFFTVTPSISSDTEAHYRITRAFAGGSNDGRVQYIIRFGQEVVINDSHAGIMFQEFADEGAASIKKSIFVINFNVNP